MFAPEQKDMRAVILPPIADIESNDTNLEPQLIRVRAANQSFFLINTSARASGSQFRNIVPPVRKIYYTNVAIAKAKRLGVSSVLMRHITPNVNIRNNEVKFTIGAIQYTCTVAEGYYASDVDLMDALAVQMTAVSPNVFTWVPLPRHKEVGHMNINAATFRFDPSKGVDNGGPLWNLPRDDIFEASKLIGSIGLRYTRFVDFLSGTLTKYTKLGNTSNNLGNNGLIFRFDLADTLEPQTIENFTNQVAFFNWDKSDSINNVDITLIDEFGQEFYVPQYSKTTSSGFWYQVRFKVEV